MFESQYNSVADAARNKLNLLKTNPGGYFISSIIAGIFIAFGGFICITSGAHLKAESAAAAKLISSFVFSAALSLVIMAGSELFTGNNFIMAAGALKKKVSWIDTIKLWIVCYIGNFVGSWIAVIIYKLTGLGNSEIMAEQFASVSLGKVSLAPMELITRGLLCNLLVCLAVWCSIKMTSESGKLIMTIWCITVFMVCGFEHSIANMSTIGVGMLVAPIAGSAISIGQYFYNLVFVTLGNMIGGIIFVAVPYYFIAKKKEN